MESRQRVCIGNRALEAIRASGLPAGQRVLLVYGAHSYSASGAESHIEPELAHLDVRRFSGFQSNPQLSDLKRGLALFRDRRPDWVLTVGGGSVLDMGKLIAAIGPLDIDAQSLLGGGEWPCGATPPLIAVPTTAGSGAEATHFAVLYLHGVKHSLAHPSLRPACAVIDPKLTYGLPARLTAVTGLDALSQAIESYWALGATRRSQAFARAAVRRLLPNVVKATRAPDANSRLAMSVGAHLAGRAIDISKTTGAHALSYTLTIRYGVPHGHAVALTLGHFMRHHADLVATPCEDPRRADHGRTALKELATLLGVAKPRDLAQRWRSLLRELGVETSLQELGIREPAAAQHILAGIDPQRLSNNPWHLSPERLGDIAVRLVEG